MRSTPLLALALACVFLLLALATTPTTASTYLTFQVDARKTRCFYEEVNAGQVLDLYFEVQRGGLLDIKFQLFDPNRNIVIDRIAFFNKPNEESNIKEGTVAYTAKTTGVYKFCFDNSSSRWTAKHVSFEIRSQRANKEEAVKLDHLGPMVDTVISLSSDLEALEQKQRTNKVREHQHFSTIKSLNNRIRWISVITSIVVAVTTWFAVTNIQKWFAQPSNTINPATHSGFRI